MRMLLLRLGCSLVLSIIVDAVMFSKSSSYDPLPKEATSDAGAESTLVLGETVGVNGGEGIVVVCGSIATGGTATAANAAASITRFLSCASFFANAS
jgi:hypothetical protein